MLVFPRGERDGNFHCNIGRFRGMARDVLPHAVYEFVAAGAGNEITLANNTAAFDRLKLRPLVLRDVSSIDTRVDLFGEALPYRS